MNLEGITLQLLTRELTGALSGGKIFKIFMPSRESLLLQVNRLNRTVNLLIDMNGALSSPCRRPCRSGRTCPPASACCCGSTWRKAGSPG